MVPPTVVPSPEENRKGVKRYAKELGKKYNVHSTLSLLKNG